MRIIFIGGTGFIGPHVVGRLVEMGHEVTVFHRGETRAELQTRPWRLGALVEAAV